MKHRVIALSIALALSACLPLKAQIVSTQISGYGALSSEGAIADDDLPVFLIDPLSQSLVDSAKVIDGRFNITVKDSVDKLMLLKSTDRYFVLFFNEGTPMEVKLGDCKIQKGSELNIRLNDCIKRIAQTEDSKNAVRDTILKIVDENKDNLIPSALINLLIGMVEPEEMLALLDTARPYAGSPLLAPARMWAKANAGAGGKYSDLTLPGPDGRAHKLSEYVGEGKYVLLDFWASWCAPCREEMPNVKKAYDKYRGKGFTVVGISLDSKADAWKKAIAELGMNWPQLSDLKGGKSPVVAVYGLQSIPYSVLINGDGKIVARRLRGSALQDKLKEIYGY